MRGESEYEFNAVTVQDNDNGWYWQSSIYWGKN